MSSAYTIEAARARTPHSISRPARSPGFVTIKPVHKQHPESKEAAVKLIHNEYGKAEVRFLKVRRDGARHSIYECSVSTRLTGDFGANYTEGDNSSCVPTDTVKNTTYILARKQFDGCIETFARTVTDHYLAKYPQVESVRVTIEESPWKRMDVGGKPHDHSFHRAETGIGFVERTAERTGATMTGGYRDVFVLKSTGSGFENYHTDENTTIPPTADRILATKFRASWLYRKEADYAELRCKALGAIYHAFAAEYSPSVQRTLYRAGEEVLTACDAIETITIHMPNVHYNLVNLDAFGLDNPNDTFYPAPEPYGDIEATVGRE